MKEKRFFERLGFSLIFIAFTAAMALAVPTNGDFSSGLSGWTVESGNVSDGGGYALFQEHETEALSSLVQEFTLPPLAWELSFDVEMSADQGGDYDEFAAPDAFTASLLDPVTKDPLIYNPPDYTDFYYMDNSPYVQTVAAISGKTVTLNVWGLAGQNVFLAFDLIGGDDGMLTEVSLDNVDISVIPAPGALLLGLIGTGAVGLWRRLKSR